ncbi:MAG TPA: heavy metal-binding domain-containing protein [Candidatus Nanopelagicaceae bacterium]|nr:heavy metal-binding domain-containing protein [Candidatus Nanopelagicaceae bacterium]
MRFFRGGGGSAGVSPEQLARAERSRQLVEAGGIPLEAEERIERQREAGATFTSDLSVDELAALRGIGYRPVALVMGSSLYRMGWINTGMGILGGRSSMSWGAVEPLENAALTAALFEARSRAVHRLVLEASGLKAEGVVGVRLEIKRWEWATGMAEFTVLGTAVRRIDQTPTAEPFTSTLNGQDMAKLVMAGYRPLRLVMGASAFQAVAFFGGSLGMMGQGAVSAWSNQEVASYTRALRLAQATGRQRMAHEAGQAGSAGVVGVEIDSHILEYPTGSESVGGRIVEWVILGTAVAPQASPPELLRPSMVVPLRP